MKYERLTERLENGGVKISNDDNWVVVYPQNYTGYDVNKKALVKLAELEDKIENGTLVELPCKVGTIVYTIYKEDWTAEYTMVASRVKGFSDCGDGLGLRFVLPFGRPAVSLVGDRIFFTRAEAEAKLKELRGEE